MDIIVDIDGTKNEQVAARTHLLNIRTRLRKVEARIGTNGTPTPFDLSMAREMLEILFDDLSTLDALYEPL